MPCVPHRPVYTSFTQTCAIACATAACPPSPAYFFFGAVTLNWKWMMSPSCTTYALPSCLYLPAAFTSAMPLVVDRLQAGGQRGSSGAHSVRLLALAGAALQ